MKRLALNLRMEESMGNLARTIANYIAPREQTIVNVGGTNITITSTSTGGTSVNTEDLYRSKQVQEFIKHTKSADPAKSAK